MKNFLNAIGLLMLLPTLGLSQVTVFVYHRFGESKLPSTNISIEVFEQQLQYLKDQRYQVLTLSEALHSVSDHSNNQPRVVLTIDDAYLSFYTNALPLLRKYGYKATLFVNTETVGGRGYMSWAQIKEAINQGVEIGNHSHSHGYFLNQPADQRAELFRADVAKAQGILEAQLALKPTLFAYPFGEFDANMKSEIKKMGFKAAAAQNSGVLASFTDLYAIPRFPMGGPFATFNGFKEKLKMKALQVNIVGEASQLYTSNPPLLNLEIQTSAIQLHAINCFIGGQKHAILKQNGNSLSIQKSASIKSRRLLYTITAQSTDGKSWYWFSHVWVNPAIKE